MTLSEALLGIAKPWMADCDLPPMTTPIPQCPWRSRCRQQQSPNHHGLAAPTAPLKVTSPVAPTNRHLKLHTSYGPSRFATA